MNGPGNETATEYQGAMPVRVLAWGAAPADVEGALRRAGQGFGRSGWQFAEVERLQGTPCPIDTRDPMTIAAEAGFDWAYAVYPLRGAR